MSLDLLGEDPAAEFLQDEEDQLRELGIDEGQFEEPAADFGFIPVEHQEVEHQEEPTFEPQVFTTPVEEPESVLKWREERAEALKKQGEDEVNDTKSWQEKAKKELDDWYKRYNEQLDKVTHENKTAEQQFVEEMISETPSGNEWEKTARFCDFNPKMSSHTKDVSRMRGMLLQLKQTPLER